MTGADMQAIDAMRASAMQLLSEAQAFNIAAGDEVDGMDQDV